jgi:hypothetical protein
MSMYIFNCLKFKVNMVLSRIRANLIKNFQNGVIIFKVRHHLYISYVSPDDGPSRLKHLMSKITKSFVCVTEILSIFVLPKFLDPLYTDYNTSVWPCE